MSELSTGCRIGVWAFMAGLPLALSGCSDTHQPVTGKVTLDGSPLPDAIVSFMPESEEGIPCFGTTDDEGKYAMQESRDANGAPVGQYVVRITTYREGKPEADPPIPRVREKVPAKYNRDTELAAEVKPGENVFDFELESGR